MAELIREWAGTERLFRLTFGGVMDLEQACGGTGIGVIFQRISTGRFEARDVHECIRLALIGGGMGPLDAKRLMASHFDKRGYLDNAQVAGDILLAVMAGVEPEPAEDEAEPKSDPAEPYRFSEVSQLCRVFHMRPDDLRAMRYADFVNMVRGFNAGSERKAEAPSEEEFLAMLDRHEERKAAAGV